MRAHVLLFAFFLGCGRLLPDVDGDGTVLVACIGDSNTAYGWPDGTTPRWCELAAREPHAASVRRGFRIVSEPVRFVNRAVDGAFACTGPSRTASGMTQVEQAVAAKADVLVIALGTNDVLAGTPTDDIMRCEEALAQAAAPRWVFVALAPPMLTTDRTVAIDALNARLRDAFPAAQVLDFHDGYARPEFRDYLHLGDEGQVKRARTALAALGAR